MNSSLKLNGKKDDRYAEVTLFGEPVKFYGEYGFDTKHGLITEADYKKMILTNVMFKRYGR